MEPRISLLALAKLFPHLSSVEWTATVVESLKQSQLVLNTPSEILFSVFYFNQSIFMSRLFILLWPAPQNSRRLTGNWREVAIPCLCLWVWVGRPLMMYPHASAFLSPLWQNFLTTVCSVPFKGHLPFCVRLCDGMCRVPRFSDLCSLPPPALRSN